MKPQGSVITFFGRGDAAAWGADRCVEMLALSGVHAAVASESVNPCGQASGACETGSRDHCIQVLCGRAPTELQQPPFPAPRVACILGCGRPAEVSAETEQLAAKRRSPPVEQFQPGSITAGQGSLDLAIYSESVLELCPEVLTGLGRQYTVSALHPVEAGAYLTGDRMRIVGRVDAWEGSLPDSSLRFTAPVRGERRALAQHLESLLCAALAAMEMGAAPESVDRTLRRVQRQETVEPGPQGGRAK